MTPRARVVTVLTLSVAAIAAGRLLRAQSKPTHPEGVVLATHLLGGRPYGVAVSATGTAYVARLDAESVSVARLPDMVWRNAIGVGSTPSHVAFNPAGTRAYVANQRSQSVSVIDVAKGVRLVDVPLESDAWNVIVSPDGARVYATTDQGSLHVIATATNEPEATLRLSSGDALRGLAFDRTGAMLYVAGRNSGNIYVVSTAARRVTSTIRVGGILQRMAVSLDGNELYVANEERGLDIVTLETGAVTTVPVGGGAYGLALSPDGAQLYVTVPSTGSLQIVDRARRTVIRDINLGPGTRPRTVAFSPRGDYAVVANEFGALHIIR